MFLPDFSGRNFFARNETRKPTNLRKQFLAFFFDETVDETLREKYFSFFVSRQTFFVRKSTFEQHQFFFFLLALSLLQRACDCVWLALFLSLPPLSCVLQTKMTATCEDDCIDTEEDVPLLQLGPEHAGGIVHVIDDKKAKKALGAQKRIIFMGVLMTIYSLAEIGLSLKVNSLVVFSDGLHNLSDAIALAIALWAERAQLKVGSP